MKKITVKINKKSFFLVSIIIILFLLLSFKTSYSNLTPVKSVKIPSTTLSYTNNEEGAWNITKSAKWLSKGKARITINIDSIVNAKNINTDVILVLDISGSMNGERLNKVKIDTINLINDIIPKGNNVALITFSDASTIISDFTSNSEILIDHINNLEAIGNTNYYQALVNVDTILKNYKFSDTRDCVVMFLTDGYPNIDSPNEIGQYNYLKTTYPDLTINGIQYEMGNELLEPLKAISDNQHTAYIKDLEQFLYKAAVSPVEYEKFIITDYIEDEYFLVENINSIQHSIGTISLEENKITWDLEKYTTGTTQTLTIDISLKNELIGIGGIYPTNKNITTEYEIRNTSSIKTSSLTPILSDNYKVIYDENSPDGCVVVGTPDSKNISVFDIVYISDKEVTCEGYQFKGWELVSNEIEKVNSKYFIMPEYNVILRATWSKLSATKSMEGKIAKVQNLYEMMANNSVSDNIKSEFVTSSSGIDFSKPSSNTNGNGIYKAVKIEGADTPIYYYRGNVTNNNIIFANYCWKIVRTTETKGIKLLYNGAPSEAGSCTATGDETSIGLFPFAISYNAIAYQGYMYGNTYLRKHFSTDLANLSGKTKNNIKELTNTNYIYSSEVTYDETTGKYTLVNGENRIWNDTYSIDTGNKFLYTCFSETNDSCEIVNYTIDSKNVQTADYIALSEGETIDNIINKEIIYGNDVIYDEETGLYTLVNTFNSKIGNWYNDAAIIDSNNGYRYTCLNDSGVCSSVKYIYAISRGTMNSYGDCQYIELSDGIDIDKAVKQMTTETDYENNSIIKEKIDEWYASNLLNYIEYLEDTTWCNDMVISNYGGWNKDGTTETLIYKVNYDINNGNLSLKCRHKNNSYTVKDLENGNGKLTYPIATLTADEILYSGNTNTSYINSNITWWTMSPHSFKTGSYWAQEFGVNDSGSLKTLYIDYKQYIRPAISLKANTRSVDGDGTPDNPFIVK